jgi:hypothetical protein
MNTQPASLGFFRKTFSVLGILASLGLLGYAPVNLIRMPAVSPDTFVPKALTPSQPEEFPFSVFPPSRSFSGRCPSNSPCFPIVPGQLNVERIHHDQT